MEEGGERVKNKERAERIALLKNSETLFSLTSSRGAQPEARLRFYPVTDFAFEASNATACIMQVRPE